MHEKLFVHDEEYLTRSQNMGTYATTAATTLAEMLGILATASADGLVDGDTAKNFALFNEVLQTTLPGKLEELQEEYSALTTAFLQDVDEADEDIY